jgi:hypothetical protein
MAIEEAEIGLLPLYSADLHQAGLPAGVQQLCDRITAADALLFVTPETRLLRDSGARSSWTLAPAAVHLPAAFTVSAAVSISSATAPGWDT